MKSVVKGMYTQHVGYTKTLLIVVYIYIYIYMSFLLEATPIVDDITIYGSCVILVVLNTLIQMSEVNRVLYITLRRKHGLPDSMTLVKWKET